MSTEATSKYRDYDPSKRLSHQIAMTESDLFELERISQFNKKTLETAHEIIHIFDCSPIRTARGIFSLMLFATPVMQSDRMWVKYEIRFKAEEILDSSFDQDLLKIYSITKADKIFEQHFVSRAESAPSKTPTKDKALADATSL